MRALVSIYNEHENKWYKIGGDNPDIKCPSSYKGISSTFVDSARNSSGQTISNVIQEDVAKIELGWRFMSIQDFAKLSKLFNEKHNGKFMVAVCFFNETIGNWEGDDSVAPNTTTNICRLFYPNDREGVVAELTLDKITGMPQGYADVSLHLIDTCLTFGS